MVCSDWLGDWSSKCWQHRFKCSNSTSSSSWTISFSESISPVLSSKISSFPYSLFGRDTLYVLDVIFFKIIDMFLMVFFLLMSSLINMKIVSWSDLKCHLLLVLVPLLLDLTGDICIRFEVACQKTVLRNQFLHSMKKHLRCLVKQVHCLGGKL